jgi:hypothetical protein
VYDTAYTLFTYHDIFVPCCSRVANKQLVDLIRYRMLMFNSSCRLNHTCKSFSVKLMNWRDLADVTLYNDTELHDNNLVKRRVPIINPKLMLSWPVGRTQSDTCLSVVPTGSCCDKVCWPRQSPTLRIRQHEHVLYKLCHRVFP